MGRRAFIETPAARALRLRVMALRRKPRPTHSRGDKHAWVSTFLTLYDAKAWEVMQPPETRLEYLRHWNLAPPRVAEFRRYLTTFEAAVQAGANHYHLRFIPIHVMLTHTHLAGQPNKLLEALLGKPAAQERKRKVHNRAARRRYSTVTP